MLGSLALLLALASSVVTASAAGTVRAGRSYVGTIGLSHSNSFGGTSISFAVSTNGKTVTATAVYSNCAVGGIGGGQVSFPTATIAKGAFKTTHSRPGLRAGLYATITIKGHFRTGGHASGTISGKTNQNLITGGHGSVCATSNPWTTTAKPSGFGVCDPLPVPPGQTAQNITDEHATCPAVDKAIKAGRYKPPLTGHATFATPAWTCRNTGGGSGTFTCKRGRASFHFDVV
jgi:hypothetical protein